MTRRSILGMLVSLGLVLAPVQGGALTPFGHLGPAGATTEASVSMDKDCSCCSPAGQCAMATCTMHCVQFATPTAPKFIAAIGHAPFNGLLGSLHEGVGWRPPAPPPRA